MRNPQIQYPPFLVVLGTVMAIGAQAGAQTLPATPRIGYVYPAGGCRGTVVKVTIGGQRLAGVSGIRVTGEGIESIVLAYDRPLTQRQVLVLRDRLEGARKKLLETGNPFAAGRGGPLVVARLAKEAGITDEELRKLADFQRSRSDPKRQPNPQIEETVRAEIRIAADADAGPRELRIFTPGGATNPLRFDISSLTEHAEAEPNDTNAGVNPGLAIPAILNGQILPGDVDRFTFSARKDDQVVVAVYARELIPYLADAVPGWFQPVVTVKNAAGRELEYADDNQFRPDPVLYCRIPDDGAYTVEVRDAIYRGREDFVYRIAVGNIPFVTRVFPMGGKIGETRSLKTSGWNLTSDERAFRPAGVGLHRIGADSPLGAVNGIPFQGDSITEVFETEPNGRTKIGNKFESPTVINGRVDCRGDVDIFAVKAIPGSEIAAEVFARRLGSPLDSALTAADSVGRKLEFNDDHEDRASGLLTHHADSRLVTRVPPDGIIYLSLRDAQAGGGPEFAYRLRVAPLAPTFELRAVPSSVFARAGTAVPITIHVIRKDGYAGEVRISLVDSPPGFALQGGVVPAGADSARINLNVPVFGRVTPFSLRMEGKSVLDGRELRIPVTPAEDMMQAFAYHHLVPANEFLVTVGRNAGNRPRNSDRKRRL